MAVPPTPVSDCPLKQLEIQDGPTNKLFEQGQTAGILNLALEAHRSVGSKSASLLLLVHSGLQQILSITLSDLLRTPHSRSRTVSIDKYSLQLCIEMPLQNKSVLASFEGKRHFSLAVCMLEKAGFTIGQYTTKKPSKVISSNPQRPPIVAANGTFDLGPRLSSITPLGGLDTTQNPGQYSDVSFTSMLSSAFAPPPAYIPPHDMSQAPLNVQAQAFQFPEFIFGSGGQPCAVDNSSEAISLNPYNIFANEQITNPQGPWTHFPLWNTVQLGESTQQSGNWDRLRDSQPVIIEAIPDSQNPPNHFTDFHLPSNEPYSDIAPHGPLKEDLNYRLPQSDSSLMHSLISNVDEINQNSRPGKDFRELMPRPRDLPFTNRQKKHANVKMTPTNIETTASRPKLDSTGQDSAKWSKQARVSYRDHGTSYDIPIFDHTQRMPTIDSLSETLNVQCQNLDKPMMSNTIDSSPRSTAAPNSPLPTESYPAVLVADEYTLTQANEAVSSLFEQYEADIARGCDAAASATFYMNKIDAVRTSFWYEMLEGLKH